MHRRGAAALGLVVVIAVAAGVIVTRVPAAAPGDVVAPSPTASLTATATVTPSPTGTATVAPSPSATGPATLSDDLGFVVTDGQEPRFIIRSEREPGAIATFRGHAPAVSPNKQRIAYWRTGDLTVGDQMRLVEIGPAISERTLYDLPPGRQGGTIVWASDGGALLFAVHTVNAGRRLVSSTMETYDLAATQAPIQTSSELPIDDGGTYVPIAWDRAAGVSAAVVIVEPGVMRDYVLWQQRVLGPGQPAVSRTPSPARYIASQVFAAPDARRVLGIDVSANALYVWPLADVAARTEIRPPVPAAVGSALWHPSSQEIGWTFGDRFDLVAPQTGASRNVHRGSSALTLGPFRADGSAVVVAERPGIGPLLLVSLPGGGPVAIPGERGGFIVASVRLR